MSLINFNVYVTVLNLLLRSFFLYAFQEKLEARIIELETALDEAQKTELKDKQTLTKLQKQLSRVSIKVKSGLCCISCISC